MQLQNESTFQEALELLLDLDRLDADCLHKQTPHMAIKAAQDQIETLKGRKLPPASSAVLALLEVFFARVAEEVRPEWDKEEEGWNKAGEVASKVSGSLINEVKSNLCSGLVPA